MITEQQAIEGKYNSYEYHAQFGRTRWLAEGCIWLTPKEYEEYQAKGYYTRDKGKYDKSGMLVGVIGGNDILQLKGVWHTKGKGGAR